MTDDIFRLIKLTAYFNYRLLRHYWNTKEFSLGTWSIFSVSFNDDSSRL